MSIPEQQAGSKSVAGGRFADVLILGIIALVGVLGFGLGVLAGKDMAQGQEFWIERLPERVVPAGGGPAAAAVAIVTTTQPESPAKPIEKVYVASKNGTKYYLPTCGTAKRIKEANQVWFATKEAAAAAGYSPAANCPGL